MSHERGRRFVVTGANTGIGRATALELARRGGELVLACRSEARTAPVLDEIRASGGKAEFLQLELDSLAQVRAAAAELTSRGRPVHVLINNAGLAGQHGLTRDGFELIFGVNHLGPFLFTELLLPTLLEAPEPRIVNVSSRSHYRAKGIDWEAVKRPTASTTGMREYEVSKLANVLFTKESARRHGGKIKSYALHPGVIASDVWRGVPWGVRHVIKLFMRSNEDGAKTSLHCATSDDVAAHDGRYYDDERERRPSRVSDDAALAAELWERSVAWTRA